MNIIKIGTLCLLLHIFLQANGQKLQVVPRAGFQYHGLSYISKGDNHPSDLDKSVLEFVVTIEADIKYSTPKFTHVVSLQSTAIGPSFTFTNQYFSTAMVPAYTGHHHASSVDQSLLSYSLEKESRRFKDFIGATWLKFHCAAGVGIGFNKSKEAYDSVLMPNSYGMQIGDSYKYYALTYTRTGVGIFLSGKAGIEWYNKRSKPFLNLQAYWHQGVKKMAEYDLEYGYGYLSYAQLQKSEKVKLKSRGTVFGVTAGVPITLLKDKNIYRNKLRGR